LIEEEKQGKSIAPLESSFEDEDDEGTDTKGEYSGENSSDSSGSSGSDNDVEESSGRKESSPKVDITD
jgi:hypothetical protein